uniref:Uncharacterized protein n=1 Tax=Pseudonaja textilis TaxID=8673 RepID=A0A670ZDG7_PSETE
MNEDTVEKIVKCIIQNEAKLKALKDFYALCPHRSSQDGGIPHHHTVHLGSTQAPCIHCSKKKRPPIHRQGRSKESKSKMHPGETTVFSVGSFELTHNKYLMKYKQSNSIRKVSCLGQEFGLEDFSRKNPEAWKRTNVVSMKKVSILGKKMEKLSIFKKGGKNQIRKLQINQSNINTWEDPGKDHQKTDLQITRSK